MDTQSNNEPTIESVGKSVASFFGKRPVAVAAAVVVAASLLTVPRLVAPASDASFAIQRSVDKAMGQKADVSAQANVLDRYGITSLTSLPTDYSNDQIEVLQVMRKAYNLSIDEATMNALPELEGQTRSSIEETLSSAYASRAQVDFEGSTSEELQEFLGANTGSVVVVKSSTVQVAHTIDIPADTTLDGNGAVFEASVRGPVFSISEVSGAAVKNCTIAGGAAIGVLLDNAANAQVESCQISGMSQKAIEAIKTSENFRITDNAISDCDMGGIIVADDSNKGIIRGNLVENCQGSSNWMAGIVVSSLASDSSGDIWAQFPDASMHYPDRESLASRLQCPHDIVVSDNTIRNNRSSGLYVDGAYLCFILGNTLVGNDKEGMCLDYGCVACYARNNTIEDNGKRANQTDDDLLLDGMLTYGRLPDESSKAKLPGMSIDNAAYNVIENNTVQANYGGGIKTVRCGVRNAIVGNFIDGNNLGANDTFVFIGVEMGNADSDSDSVALDYAACYQNAVVNNRVTGGHAIGVFVGAEGTGNLTKGNYIDFTDAYSYLSLSQLDNDFVDNRYTGAVALGGSK